MRHRWCRHHGEDCRISFGLETGVRAAATAARIVCPVQLASSKPAIPNITNAMLLSSTRHAPGAPAKSPAPRVGSLIGDGAEQDHGVQIDVRVQKGEAEAGGQCHHAGCADVALHLHLATAPGASRRQSAVAGLKEGATDAGHDQRRVGQGAEQHQRQHMFAPNSPLRSVVTALAQPATAQAEPVITGWGAPGVAPLGNAVPPTKPVPPKRSPAHFLWAVLIARIYEVFPLPCPMCGGQMRLIAFITEGTQIKKILNHLGAACEPPHISPARGPPLWEDCSYAQMGDAAQTGPDWATEWDEAAQPASDFEVDQRINW